MLADFSKNQPSDVELDVSEYGQEHSDELSVNVATSFSAAAQQYKQFDCVQRLSAAHLFSQLSNRQALGDECHLLDVGCGPGTSFSLESTGSQVSSVTALDIAPGMLQRVNQDFPQYTTVCADAQRLPFSSQQFDLIYSNLAMQWCQDLPAALTESARVLRTGGRFYCAIVADGSLPELKTLGLRHNQFYSENHIVQSLQAEHWSDVSVRQHTLQVHFSDLKALLYSIKGVGASTDSGRIQGASHSGMQESLVNNDSQTTNIEGVQLRGRRDWIALQQRAEGIRQAEGVPLSYNIVFIEAVAR